MIDRSSTDLGYGIRQLQRRAVFRLVASASLAIGIVAAVGFTVLPAPDPEGAYGVYTGTGRGRHAPNGGSSYADYLALTRYGPFAHLPTGINQTVVVKVAPSGASSAHCRLRYD